MADQAQPAWGSFPAEQYLIRNWDKHPHISPPERRLKLIEDFLTLDVIPSEWDAVGPGADGRVLDILNPTPDQIETILRPWRPQSVRTLAAHIATVDSSEDYVDSFWIRTHYAPNQEEKWQELLLEAPDSDRFSIDVEAPPQGLSEPSIFSSPGLTPEQAWDKALLYIPEATGSRYKRRIKLASAADRAEARSEIELHGAPRTWPEHDGCSPDLDKYRALHQVQMEATSCDVVIVDEEAFRTGEICLLSTDVRGNVVRWWRLTPEEIYSELNTYSNDGTMDDVGLLEEMEGKQGTGEKYKVDGGELAGLVYGLGGRDRGEGEGEVDEDEDEDEDMGEDDDDEY